jgi:hypothetical protein
MTRVLLGATLIAGAAAAAVAAAVLLTRPSPRASTTTRYVAAGGSDTGSCPESDPCATIDYAYHLAPPGGTVELAPGTYPDQQVTTKASDPLGSAPVTIRGEAGGLASIPGSLAFLGARDVVVQHIQLGQLAILPSTRSALSSATVYSSGIELDHVRLKNFYTRSASDVTLRDSDTGHYSYSPADHGSSTIGAYDGMPPSTGIVLDHVSFAGIRRDSSPSHAECLFLQAVDGIVIRDSRFVQCPIFAIFSQAVGTPALNPQHVTIENNLLGHPGDGGSSSIYVDYRGGTPPTNWLIRFNSFGGGLRFADGSSFPGIVVDSNVGENASGYCGAGVTYEHNVWSEVTCGATDRIGAQGYVNAAALDFRLRPCSAAIDAGNPASYPARDIAGHERPIGRAPDAGAWEAPLPKTPCR